MLTAARVRRTSTHRELRQRSALTLISARPRGVWRGCGRFARATIPNVGTCAQRVWFQQLEAVAPIRSGGRGDERIAPSEPTASVVPPRPIPDPGLQVPAPHPRRSLGPIVAIVLLVAVVAAGAFYGWRWWSGPRALQQARSAYAAGRRTEARDKFVNIARRAPKLAEPHIYLGRMAREDGDRATAFRELELAVRLEPSNATATREMAAYLLSIGDAQRASRFYVRAIEANPSDRTAMGYLGCALVRLGRFDEAQRWFARLAKGLERSRLRPPTCCPRRATARAVKINSTQRGERDRSS